MKRVAHWCIFALASWLGADAYASPAAPSMGAGPLHYPDGGSCQIAEQVAERPVDEPDDGPAKPSTPAAVPAEPPIDEPQPDQPYAIPPPVIIDGKPVPIPRGNTGPGPTYEPPVDPPDLVQAEPPEPPPEEPPQDPPSGGQRSR